MASNITALEAAAMLGRLVRAPHRAFTKFNLAMVRTHAGQQCMDTAAAKRARKAARRAGQLPAEV